MAVLEHLEPRGVFRFFEEMCAIPHGSGNTKAVSDWLVDFAKQRGLEHYQDALNNVIIIKPAAPGYEDAPAVILQSHMDMVCAKAPDCAKDMDTEGLDLVVDGDIVYAKGTTLGADDGLGVAMSLALMDDESLSLPRLEAVFTVDEETGMYGAFGIDVSPLQGRAMINMDSEEEGVFTVSCAGGNVSRMALPVSREACEGTALTIAVSGLKGGHSGVEIDRGRGNASMLLGRVLRAVQKQTALRIGSVTGGQKDNAIPVDAQAAVVAGDEAVVRAVCAAMEADLRNELRATDPGVTVTVTAGECALPMDQASTDRVVCLLCCAPNGIQVMSAEVPGLVQTSLNLGVLYTEGDTVHAGFCVRSSVDSQKQMLVDRLESLAAQLGGTLQVEGSYPGWEYKPESPLREKMVQVFTEQYGRAPRVEAIHAGVECGLFAGKIPGLDCVCIGPDLADVHTCRERLFIGSLQRTYAMVAETLRRMKA